MSAIISVYKDSGHTELLSAGLLWGTNQYVDFGTVDITSGGSSADIPLYGVNTGNAQATNIYAQAAPAALTTVTTGGTYAVNTNIPVGSNTNLTVGQAYDIVLPISDPGAGNDYSYPLSPTYRAQQAVCTVNSGGYVQFNAAVTCVTGDQIHTAGTLAILGQVATAPDSSGSHGTYGSGGAATLVAAGPVAAPSGTVPFWCKGTWLTGDIEGTHRFGIRNRCTSG